MSPLQENTKIVLPFDEGSGSTTYDYSGNNYNGTITGATYDKINDGAYTLTFSGSGQYVNYDSHASNFNVLDTLSVECWMKTDYTGSTLGMMIAIYGSSYYFWLQYTGDGESLRLGYYTGANDYRLDSESSITNGKWHHIVGVVDYTNNIQNIYIDGVLDVSSTDSITAGTHTASTFNIGRHPSNIQLFNGSLRGMVVYNKPLTADWVKKRYQETYINEE